LGKADLNVFQPVVEQLELPVEVEDGLSRKRRKSRIGGVAVGAVAGRARLGLPAAGVEVGGADGWRTQRGEADRQRDGYERKGG